MFGGEYSLVFLEPNTVVIDKSRETAQIYNFSMKVEYFANAMFASKFLVPGMGKWYFVLDPIKAIMRLGRHDYYFKKTYTTAQRVVQG